MGISRHSFKRAVSINGKTILATNKCSTRIYQAVLDKKLPCDIYIMKQGDRLDIIAYKKYKNSDYWWIIAAASGIGWGLQLTPGTILAIPRNLNQLFSYVG
jgi:hypothetical protein